MRLEKLVEEINEAVYARIMENRTVSSEEARETARMIGLAALKYGDLSNQASKDYTTAYILSGASNPSKSIQISNTFLVREIK